jgi:TetR/AcrR family transcriptional regulator, regulator of cefoperazone and chloramphenicol sensitivity
MVSPLEKARKDPDSMKAKILGKARRIFGQYGFHGATTRMIAENVGIDISTLYYHWGEKGDLYEAVVLDINEDLKIQLKEVEHMIQGLPAAKGLELALDVMTEYLFEHSEISNLILLRYIAKTRDEAMTDMRVPELVNDIARTMGFTKGHKEISNSVKMRVLGLMNSIHNFVSGEEFFRSMLDLERPQYIALVKNTLKFMLLPAFTGTRVNGKAIERPKEKNAK